MWAADAGLVSAHGEGILVYKLPLSGGLLLSVCLAVLITPTFVMASGPEQVRTFQVRIQDNCDPATFNLPPPNGAGSGTCIGLGSTTFVHFLDELTRLQRAPQWHFSPDSLHMRVGDSFVATNQGGELHSFTEVDAFGGGIIPLLNDLSKSGATVPECAAAAATIGQPGSSFVFPGQSFTDTEGLTDVGHPVLYQCCIHPWMHDVITVRQ
jgi:hypothetical protein